MYCADNVVIELIGRSANTGRAEGKAAVFGRGCLPEEVEASPGDVLVVHNMSPDMIVKTIGIVAVVAEVGGVTTHAATLCREFGIPCVVGIPSVTDLVPSGALIEVNGDRGIVRFCGCKVTGRG